MISGNIGNISDDPLFSVPFPQTPVADSQCPALMAGPVSGGLAWL